MAKKRVLVLFKTHLDVGFTDLAETVTHDELMKEDGIYRRFVEGRREAVSWKIGAGA